MKLKPFKIDPTLSDRKLAETIREKMLNYVDDTHFNIVDGYRRDLVLMFKSVQHRKDFFTYLWNNHTDLHPRIKEDNVRCLLGLVSLKSFPSDEYIDNLIDKLRTENYNK